jgi:beta-aspartyl-peptidase (threonine type)
MSSDQDERAGGEGPRRAWAVAVHGGAGNSKENEAGCWTAARVAADALARDAVALDAVVDAVVSLEDDGRFNAGSGSIVGLDGETFELDASVMDSSGALGAVACVSTVRNPIRLARAVSETPHCLLVGQGAERFARRAGFAEHRHDPERARAEHVRLLRALDGPDPQLPGVPNPRFREHWNYRMPWEEAQRRYGCGTVGAVARDAQGRYAVATSTGGSAPALLGRVGDTPLPGAGFWCGDKGAVGATGIGEAIIRQLLARTVYGWIEAGRPLQQALDDGVALFGDDTDVGLIAVSAEGAATSSNRAMPVATLKGGA